MANTTNFGWETPDDTDLVKDGAAAIRTLGSAIDTSLVDLKGGTTGQVLAKASNTDMDFTWVTSDDADAIQNSIVDAKGDLISATADNTPARLAVGTNGQVLTANSSTATGLEWITLSTGGMTLLASGSLSGSSVDLTSISGSYNNLQLVVRAYRPSGDTDLKLRFNSDSGTRYRTFESNSSGDFNLTFMRFCNSSQDSGAGQGLFIANIYDYANTTSWKIADTVALFNNGTTNTNADYFRATSVYNQTSAISAISIFPSSGTFSAGTYSLYGVK